MPFLLPNRTNRKTQSTVRAFAIWLCTTLLMAFPCLPHLLGQASTDHVQRALQLMNGGDLDGAEREAKLALRETSTEGLGWATLGTIRLEQYRYDQGIEFLQKALRLNPNLIGARISLGGAYLLKGQRSEARRMFQQALRGDPKNFNARLNLAQMESEDRDYQASLKTAEAIAPALRRSPEGILLLAGDYAGLGRTDSMRGLIEDWMALPDVSAASGTIFANLLEKTGLYAGAVRVLERAKSSGPPSLDLELALAKNYRLDGDLPSSAANYHEALRLKPDCIACLTGLAKVSEQQGNSERALANLIRAKALAPEDPEVLFEFGRLCLERDLVEDAIPALEKASALRPDNDRYSYVLGTAYVGKGTPKPAVSTFRKLAAKHPSDGAVNYALGCALYLDQDFDEADRYLTKSLELQPHQRAASFYLGLVAEKRGDPIKAIRILAEVTARYPDFIQARESLGTLLVKERRYAEAEEQLGRAIKLNPNSLQAHYQLGVLFGRTGKQQESEREIALARKLENEQRAHKSAQMRLLLPDQPVSRNRRE